MNLDEVINVEVAISIIVPVWMFRLSIKVSMMVSFIGSGNTISTGIRQMICHSSIHLSDHYLLADTVLLKNPLAPKLGAQIDSKILVPFLIK
jgi:hypothetical protein